MSRTVTVNVTRPEPAEPGPTLKQRATDYVRGLIARTVGDDPVEYAVARWGERSEAARIVKAGIASSGSADLLVPGHSARDAFFRLVVEQSILGRMTEARSVGFNVRTITPSAGARGFWVGEKRAVPVSRFALDGDALPSRKLGGLVIVTFESLRDPASEGRVVDDLVRACTGTLDEAVVGDQAGTDTLPAGLLDGVSAGPASGDPTADVAGLIESFTGDLSTSAFITDPTVAAQLALHGGYAFRNLGATGGEALGIPWLVSRSSPRTSDAGQIMLADQAQIAVGFGGLDLKRSTAALVEADDDPTGEGSTPTGASRHRINLFQNELIGLLLTVHANWRKVRPDAVVALAAASYGSS